MQSAPYWGRGGSLDRIKINGANNTFYKSGVEACQGFFEYFLEYEKKSFIRSVLPCLISLLKLPTVH
jgi:hypothetical protein